MSSVLKIRFAPILILMILIRHKFAHAMTAQLVRPCARAWLDSMMIIFKSQVHVFVQDFWIFSSKTLCEVHNRMNAFPICLKCLLGYNFMITFNRKPLIQLEYPTKYAQGFIVFFMVLLRWDLYNANYHILPHWHWGSFPDMIDTVQGK